MSQRYAQDTSVSVERSKAEIERIISRYGAEQFFSGWEADAALIGFRCHGRFVRFRLQLPEKKKFEYTEGGRKRPGTGAVEAAYEQAIRQKWRALALVLKAKLEAVESGISDFETEFLGNVTMGKQTVGEWIKPQLEELYTTGRPLALMPGVE